MDFKSNSKREYFLVSEFPAHEQMQWTQMSTEDTLCIYLILSTLTF